MVLIFVGRPLGQTLKLYLNSLSIRPEGSGVAFSGAVDNSENRQIQFAATDSALDRITDATVTPIESTPESQPLVNRSQKTNIQTISDTKMESNQTDTTPAVEETNVESKEEDISTKTSSARRSYKYDDPPVVFKDVDVRLISLFIFIIKNLIEIKGR